MTRDELEAIMRESLEMVQNLSDRDLKIALNSGILDRMFERKPCGESN